MLEEPAASKFQSFRIPGCFEIRDIFGVWGVESLSGLRFGVWGLGFQNLGFIWFSGKLG